MNSAWIDVADSMGADGEAHTPDPASPPRTFRSPLRPSLVQLEPLLTWPAEGDDLLWCLKHRAVRLTGQTVTTTDPASFGLPSVPIRPRRLAWWQRSLACDFSEAFVAETIKHATADPRCALLTRTDVVHPCNEFYRDGPYLWARLRGELWVLVEIDLWPQLRADTGCCIPRPLDLFKTLGVTTLAEDTALLAQAENALGPNVYVGICPCAAW